MYLITIKQEAKTRYSVFAPIEPDFIEDYFIYSLDKLHECVCAFEEKYFSSNDDENNHEFLEKGLIINIKKVEAID